MAEPAFDDLGLPEIDPQDVDRLAPELIERLESQLATTAEARVRIAQLVHQEVAAGIAKGGALMAYRERVRGQAVNAFFAMASIDLNDHRKMVGLQIAIARYVDVEIFVTEQLRLFDEANSPEVPPSGDDDLYAGMGEDDGSSPGGAAEDR